MKALMKLRVALAALTSVLVLSILAYTAFSWEDVRIVKDREFNDLIKAGMQLKVEQSRAEFQLALLVMGALWTLIVAKKDEAKLVLSDRPELFMFLGANILLLMSCIYHFVYVEDIAAIYAVAGAFKGATSIPDVLGSGINNPYRFQLWSLAGGIGAAALAVFSAHKLK